MWAVQYLYPIDLLTLDNQEFVLVMYQDERCHTQLHLYNLHTNVYEKLLSSQYNPVGVQLLPDNSGFSFIDKGLLKIKKFKKRSAKIIELDTPVYDIGIIYWIDNNNCYFHAKHGKRYGIYQCNINGDITPIVTSNISDCMYPQKVGDILFYIERDMYYNHYIVQTTYAADGLSTVKKIIKNFKQDPIAFLCMHNKNEGSVIMHPAEISHEDSVINFQYYFFYHQADVWYVEQFFTFELPTKLFFDNNYMLREHMLPLLPKISKQGVNFNSKRSNTFFDSLYYEVQNKKILPHPCSRFFCWPNQKSVLGYFAPIMVNGQYIYGCMWE